MKGHSVPIMWQMIAFFSLGFEGFLRLLSTVAIVREAEHRWVKPTNTGPGYDIYIPNVHVENRYWSDE